MILWRQNPIARESMKIELTHNRDTGRVRKRQEDTCYSAATPHGAILILSDGMGGHGGGDLASQVAVEAAAAVLTSWIEGLSSTENVEHTDEVEESIDSGTSVHSTEENRFDGPPIAQDVSASVAKHRHPDFPVSVEEWMRPAVQDNEELPNIPNRHAIRDLLKRAVIQAQLAVCQVAQDNPFKAGNAGCTLTIALIVNYWAYIAHIGDSRAYLHRQGKLNQITLDHSGATLLVTAGLITPEEARTHPESHSLYRFLGASATELTLDIFYEPLEADDRLLLCSDGLWGMVEDEAIAELLNTERSLKQTVTELIKAANEHGGEDNISVGLAQVKQ